ncbi:helix-turn-helix DNA binding domain protein [Gordonia phage Rabbitrun]|uniref:Helix-turn-helix DNA binding domain protein n=1 Tax=Gordonia phage Rabbitrun TaxID=2762280 RepID=A0A7G8LIU1_9CAUD|nr:helix-turn-helix DNA binding domain protein [Gordonia phage Rabbitrun]QNJ57163.1 helix-turn-helix DNA binding domain protein [Gordonia phage Rabbitrun]
MDDELTRAREELDAATERLRTLTLDAIAGGMSKSRVHELTGVARSTLNRWCANE